MAFKEHMFKMMLVSLEKAMHCLILLHKTNKHHHSCNIQVLCCTHRTSSGERLRIATPPSPPSLTHF